MRDRPGSGVCECRPCAAITVLSFIRPICCSSTSLHTTSSSQCKHSVFVLTVRLTSHLSPVKSSQSSSLATITLSTWPVAVLLYHYLASDISDLNACRRLYSSSTSAIVASCTVPPRQLQRLFGTVGRSQFRHRHDCQLHTLKTRLSAHNLTAVLTRTVKSELITV